MCKQSVCAGKADYKTITEAMEAGRRQMERCSSLRLYAYQCSCEQWHLTRGIARGRRHIVGFKLHAVILQRSQTLPQKHYTVDDLVAHFRRTA